MLVDSIELKQVSRSYRSGAGDVVKALREVDLRIEAGTFAAITGPSGCGKSTLLHLLGGLDAPSSGEIQVGGFALHNAGEKERVQYRRKMVGIVFQFFNLLPTLTVAENAALPLVLAGASRKLAAEKSRDLLALVGLEGRSGHFPHQLSGGEMQRTAIARALVHDPVLLLADEPTGNLDSANAKKMLDLLAEIHERRKTTMVVVTHSSEVARAAQRQIQMEDGQVV